MKRTYFIVKGEAAVFTSTSSDIARSAGIDARSAPVRLWIGNCLLQGQRRTSA